MKLNYIKLLSNFAFKSNLRRYSMAIPVELMAKIRDINYLDVR